ncbi:leucine-rich repeat protein kinase family protein [Actinidia rufa]|uniref:Leucine-rich repeat protein kinase family protein n=1 Tax=Actinidia rufa TaxID=165716 RepID=A0A7J0H4V9_9ERIC|nr:leucine-rich repeat protein kinase family protein [Actinidia rufa]
MQTICLMILLLVELAKGESDVDALLELKKGIQKDPLGRFLFHGIRNHWHRMGAPIIGTGFSCSKGSVTSITLNDLGLVGDFDFPVIAGLKMLRNLSIPNNHFTGTTTVQVGSIGKLEQLKYLDLRSNGFTGDVMHLLSQLGSVGYVDLSCNQFIGSLDLGLSNSSFVSGIQYFNISHNSLDGAPFSHDGMPYFDSLRVFDASSNQFVGKVPSFNFIVSLQILRLGSNHLSGSLPEALLQESSMVLSELDLSLNQLEGSVGSITSVTLKNLNLSSNKLSGPLPAKLGHCAIVDLSNNLLSGNLSRIQNWGNYVEVIDLSSNSLTGTFPIQTSQFLRLTSFKVSNNSLEGVLPPVLGTYPEIKTIDFSLNQLNGFLLPSLFNSTRLTDLNLSYNNFTGPIPLQPFPNIPFVGSVQNLSLASLDLSHNSLTGLLPPEIGEFCSMAHLDLSNNHFEGGIPDILPDGLTMFNVSYNDLSGVVPENLRSFPDSSFHPGNSLLTFPSVPSSLTNVPNMSSRGHRSHMKSAMKAALIAGLVGGASIIMLVAIMICYRTHQQGSKSNSLKGDGERKGAQQEIPSRPAHHKNVDPSTSCSSPHDHTSSSQLGSAHQLKETSSVVQRPKDLGLPELIRKNDGFSSSMSLISANPDSLKVCSPDKLAGDLYLFDGSLVFTAEELSCAPAEVIGRSCHGTLYKAVLESGHVIVVKWLKEGIAKGKKEFAREAKKLGNINHPNLVSLQGYYWGPKEHEKLILSFYINAPCLAFYLHGALRQAAEELLMGGFGDEFKFDLVSWKKVCRPLEVEGLVIRRVIDCKFGVDIGVWKSKEGRHPYAVGVLKLGEETERRTLPPLSVGERFKVAVDVARCLNYLHNERAIPHGNLKSTNILIETPGLNALLTDYSLHRIMTPAGTADQVLNAGALGYRPPEFASTSKPWPSLKSDVYAFGIIMLELLTGRSSAEIVSGNLGVVDLTEWVTSLASKNRSIECFDKLILGAQNLDDMLQVALRCILPAPDRPDMKTVFEDLSSIVHEPATTGVEQ